MQRRSCIGARAADQRLHPSPAHSGRRGRARVRMHGERSYCPGSASMHLAHLQRAHYGCAHAWRAGRMRGHPPVSQCIAARIEGCRGRRSDGRRHAALHRQRGTRRKTRQVRCLNVAEPFSLLFARAPMRRTSGARDAVAVSQHRRPQRVHHTACARLSCGLDVVESVSRGSKRWRAISSRSCCAAMRNGLASR